MTEESQQDGTLSVEQTQWIGGSTIVRRFEDIYDVDEIINRGKFAVVNKCRLRNRQTIKAVKRIPKHGNRKTPIKNSLTIIQLDHPNLVVVREILESPTDIYIVQDYVDGPNLYQHIGQLQVYTEHDLSKYCSQILKGLKYLHERNVYHGKLHGENILIRAIDNEPKLCLTDFTYSNLCTRDAIHLLVNESPSFCAPEILRGQSISSSSDVWQLGILIFFCLTGKYPFSGTQKKIFNNILTGKIDYDSSEWDHVSLNGKSFVNNLLQVNIRDRLTIYQIVAQPWLHEKVYRSENLSEAQANIIGHQNTKNSSTIN